MELCCADMTNRKMLTRTTLPTPVGSDKKDIAYKETCVVCNRSHYGIEAVPMHFGVTPSSSPAKTTVAGSIKISIDAEGAMLLTVDNIARDKDTLLSVLEEAKVIVNRMK
jgi:hypothetical protein